MSSIAPRAAALALVAIGSVGATSAHHGAEARHWVEPPNIQQVSADAETAPVAHGGDSADDPAIWVHPSNPQQSLIIGNDKQGALEVYTLDGTRRQRITSGTSFWGNVDVRQQVQVSGTAVDVVATLNNGLRLYSVDVTTRRLVSSTEGRRGIQVGGGEGLCLYAASDDRAYAFVVARSGRVRQYEITDADHDGLLAANRVRQFSLSSEAEGCVVDDARAALYLSQENVGLWRLGAEPDAGAGATIVDRVGANGHLVSDVEGVTLVATGTTGYVIVSAQNVARPQRSYFAVYTRRANAYVGAFRIVGGTAADGCQRTDGVAAYAGNFGPLFPEGIFVCQDNTNKAPGAGHQDFKFTRLERIVTLR